MRRKRRTPYQIAQHARKLSENDLTPRNLDSAEISAIEESFRALGVERDWYDEALKEMSEIIELVRREAKFPTLTMGELRKYFRELKTTAKNLEHLLHPLDEEWHQVDRYWPEDPDDMGDKEHSQDLLRQLSDLHEATAAAERNLAEIYGHSSYCRKSPHELLAICLFEFLAKYLQGSISPGSDKSQVAIFYSLLCKITEIPRRNAPRKLLSKYFSGEKRPGHVRPPWEYPFHGTKHQIDIPAEDLEWLKSLFE